MRKDDLAIKILLVEDEPGDAAWIRRGLRHSSPESYDVTWVQTLAEGRQMLAREKFDLMLLDISLPDSCGLDTVHAGCRAAGSIPVVVLTGHVDQEFALRTLDAGAQDYLVKGEFEDNLLIRSLRYAIARARVEAALRKSEERLAYAQIIAKTGDYIWDVKTGEINWSDGMYNLLGYDKADIDIIDFATVNAAIHHPDDMERVTKWLNDCIESGKTTLVPNGYRLIRKDKGVIYVYANGIIEYIDHKDDSDSHIKVFITIQDISELKRVQEALRQSEAGYRSLVDNTPDLIYSFDRDGRHTAVNNSVCRAMGLEASEIIGKTHRELGFTEEVASEWEALHRRVYNTADVVNVVTTTPMPNGAVRIYEVALIPIVNENGIIEGIRGSSRDITARKEAEIELKNTRDQYQSLVYNVPGVIFRCSLDKHWTMLYMTDTINSLTGYPAGDFIQNSVRTYESVIHPEDTPFVARSIYAAVAEGRHWDIEYRVCHREGGVRWVHEKGRGISDENTKQDYLDGLILDVTDRRLAEEELTISKKKLEEAYSQLDEEINKAAQIHQRLLPAEIPQTETISIAAHHQSAERMGGDTYNVIKSGHQLIIYVADVMGHGLDGAVISFFIKESIDSYVVLNPDKLSPQKILGHLSSQYYRGNYSEEQYICIFLGVIDLETNALQYSSAGFQTRPLVRMGNGEKVRLNTKGSFIGSIIPLEMLNFAEQTLALTPGTTVIISTDGLPEQEIGDDHWFMDYYEDIFYKNSHLPPGEIVQAMNKGFCLHHNNNLTGDDDITYLVLRVSANPFP